MVTYKALLLWLRIWNIMALIWPKWWNVIGWPKSRATTSSTQCVSHNPIMVPYMASIIWNPTYGTHIFFPYMASMEILWKNYGHNFPYNGNFFYGNTMDMEKFIWPYYGRNRIFHNFPYYGKNFHSMENLWRSISHKFPYHIFFTSCASIWVGMKSRNR